MKAQEFVRANLSVLCRALFKADDAPVAPIGSSLHLQAMFLSRFVSVVISADANAVFGLSKM
jgi:hypothetical protein